LSTRRSFNRKLPGYDGHELALATPDRGADGGLAWPLGHEPDAADIGNDLVLVADLAPLSLP
jgi:hypothetical protein